MIVNNFQYSQITVFSKKNVRKNLNIVYKLFSK